VPFDKITYRDELEQMLQEAADSFRLYPSHRVWHSIYNDRYPGKKWPSALSWLLIVTSLLFTGMPDNNITPANNKTGYKKQTSYTISGFGKANILPKGANSKYLTLANNTSVTLFKQQHSLYNNSATKNVLLIADNKKTDQEKAEETNENTGKNIMVQSKKYHSLPINNTFILTSNFNEVANKNIKREVEENVLNKIKKSVTEESRFEYQIYATPSVGFREQNKNTNNSEKLINSSPINSKDGSLTSQIPAFNIEAGGNILFNFSKSMRIKAGLQLNYSNYKTNNNISDYSEGRMQMINEQHNQSSLFDITNTSLSSDVDGKLNDFNNERYQVSIPVGADLVIAGAGDFQWFAGATLQPTFIVPGNAFLQASETRNYLPDPSLVRNWNVNGGIETFITYKTKLGITLNAGPQFRYQMLSTYKNQFTYNERLYYIGIKLGISSRF